LALGKLGGREMTATSDLDLILLYDHAEGASSDGRRPLAGPQYFARFTQRLIAALSAPTAEGRLYDVDFRLRPSGRAGPLATHIAGFERYQREEAWTWEHMALTRGRVIVADGSLRARSEGAIRAVLELPREPSKLRSDVAEMRERVAREKGGEGAWDLKLAPGGLLDVEFLAQTLQLAHAHARADCLSTNTEEALIRLGRAGLLPPDDADSLIEACQLQHALTQILRVCLETPFDPASASPGLKALLARAGGLPDFAALDAHLREVQARVRQLFVSHVGPVG